SAQQRWHWLGGNVFEHPLLASLRQFQQHRILRRAVAQPQRLGTPLRVEQAQGKRNVERLLDIVAAGAFFHPNRRALLRQGDRAAPRGGLVIQRDRHARRTRLAVPATEYRKV